MALVTLHGSLFCLLKDFVNSKYNGAWSAILEKAGLPQRDYEMHETYPYEEFEAILSQLSERTGLPLADLKEKFGEELVPSLLHMYGKFMDPKWKTFELLLYTEMVMHKAVRKEETKAHPPVLNVSRVHDKLLIIDYNSKRKLASLAIGIIKGVAKYYNESEKVKVIPMTEPNEERVQIRVEFL